MIFLVPDPIYCRNASAGQLECDGQHAAQFYTALLTFALYWNTTLASEAAMEIEVPVHGVDVANFAKHSIVREMITRRDRYRESRKRLQTRQSSEAWLWRSRFCC